MVRIRPDANPVKHVVETNVKQTSPFPDAESSPPLAGPSAEDHVPVTQLRRMTELVSAGRLAEAEAELLITVERAPRDLRVLKLLALVRFKRGNLQESRQVYRLAAEVAPEDASTKLNLGLIALKLESFAEAARELEAAARLQPDDRRTRSYLGYAYARSGAPAQAATAFRRAGQHELAAEMERAATTSTQAPEDARPEDARNDAQVDAQVAWRAESAMTDAGADRLASAGGETPRPLLQQSEVTPEPEADARASALVTSLASFASARLLALPASATPLSSVGQGVVRFIAGVETHVRESALLVSLGAGGLLHARRRVRGQLSDEKLATERGRFLRVEGGGDLLLVSPDPKRGLVALSLDHDIFYVVEERAVAWGDEVVWESGSVPGDGTALLQFRGSGRVVIVGSEAELVAVRVAEGDRLTVPIARVAGWLGRVVVQGRLAHLAQPDANGLHHVLCEGEGVLLLSKHGESR
jgi:Tfp pilus assembly protein PilF/uncharacterized protein (AIM24 family)